MGREGYVNWNLSSECSCDCFPLSHRKDAFSGAEYIQEGLQIEQASILYNLGEWTLPHWGGAGEPWVVDSSPRVM